jgi:hypothetical protein
MDRGNNGRREIEKMDKRVRDNRGIKQGRKIARVPTTSFPLLLMM